MPLFGTRGAASVTGFGGLAKLGYLLRNSLRFRASNSAYLNRTQGTSTNQNIGTWSLWFKRGALGSTQRLLEGYTASSDTGVGALEFGSDNKLYFFGWTTDWRVTTQVFRDPSAWYHIVLTVDTTQSTASNRVKLYVNGSEITAFDTSNNPIQNNTFGLNNNSAVLQIGRRRNVSNNDNFFDGYMTEVNFIDGQALTPYSFAKTDAATNQWVPIKYGSTYGTNGFYLPFTNTTSTSTLGNDFSGNSNTFTVNNISLTAGSTYDSMTDVPTLTSATAANYCVMNPLDKGTSFSISNGNLTVDINASRPVFTSVKGTFGITSNKYYWEFVKTSSGSGLSESGVWATDNLSLNTNSDLNLYLASLNNIGMFGSTAAGDLIKTGLNSQDYSTLGSYTNGDVIGIAFDADAGKLYAFKNGTEFTGQTIGSGTSILPTMAIGKTYQPFVYSGNGGSGTELATINFNFGQRPFQYSAPAGFKALNTYNLP